MKRFFSCAALVIFIFSTVIYGDNINPPLNQVTFRVQREQWATTQTAKVTVLVNALLNNVQLENIHQQILQKLNNIAENNWHITRFYRYQDNTGLERLQISAVVRLKNDQLANLREKAEKISKPGEKFTVQNIEFTPSNKEIQLVKAALREKIYQQIDEEINRLNKVYPQSHFAIHNINFQSSEPVMPRTNGLVLMQQQKNAAVNSLSVSDKITMIADVNVASIMKVTQ